MALAVVAAGAAVAGLVYAVEELLGGGVRSWGVVVAVWLQTPLSPDAQCCFLFVSCV